MDLNESEILILRRQDMHLAFKEGLPPAVLSVPSGDYKGCAIMYAKGHVARYVDHLFSPYLKSLQDQEDIDGLKVRPEDTESTTVKALLDAMLLAGVPAASIRGVKNGVPNITLYALPESAAVLSAVATASVLTLRADRLSTDHPGFDAPTEWDEPGINGYVVKSSPTNHEPGLN